MLYLIGMACITSIVWGVNLLGASQSSEFTGKEVLVTYTSKTCCYVLLLCAVGLVLGSLYGPEAEARATRIQNHTNHGSITVK